jgi:hypothetical protein
LAFEAIQSGAVGVAGSTGVVLHNSLIEINTLAYRSIATAHPVGEGMEPNGEWRGPTMSNFRPVRRRLL